MTIKKDQMEELLELNRQQLSMLRFLAFDQLREVIEKHLTKDSHKIIFEHSTGASTRKIANLAGVSHATVASLWDKWGSLGIVVEDPDQPGRYNRICSLSQIGIEVPATGGD